MITRKITKFEPKTLVTLVTEVLDKLDLIDLERLLALTEMEIQYREDQGLLDEERRYWVSR